MNHIQDIIVMIKNIEFMFNFSLVRIIVFFKKKKNLSVTFVSSLFCLKNGNTCFKNRIQPKQRKQYHIIWYLNMW